MNVVRHVARRGIQNVHSDPTIFLLADKNLAVQTRLRVKIQIIKTSIMVRYLYYKYLKDTCYLQVNKMIQNFRVMIELYMMIDKT